MITTTTTTHTGITRVHRTIPAGERDRQDRVIIIIRHHHVSLMIIIGIPTNLAGLNTTASVMAMEGQMTGMINQETMAAKTTMARGIKMTDVTINTTSQTIMAGRTGTIEERGIVGLNKTMAVQSIAGVSLRGVGVGFGSF